jgi:hypothetical protein
MEDAPAEAKPQGEDPPAEEAPAEEAYSSSGAKRPAADEGLHVLCCIGIMTAVHSDFVASYHVSATSMVHNIIQRLRRSVTLFSDILASCHYTATSSLNAMCPWSVVAEIVTLYASGFMSQALFSLEHPVRILIHVSLRQCASQEGWQMGQRQMASAARRTVQGLARRERPCLEERQAF